MEKQLRKKSFLFPELWFDTSFCFWTDSYPTAAVGASDHNFSWDHSVVNAELCNNVLHGFPSSWFLMGTTENTHKFSLVLVLRAESPVAECLGRHIPWKAFPKHLEKNYVTNKILKSALPNPWSQAQQQQKVIDCVLVRFLFLKRDTMSTVTLIKESI